MATHSDEEMPVSLFLSHGGGPCFFMDTAPGELMSEMDSKSAIAAQYRQISSKFPRPSAIVLVTAHWEPKVVHNVGSTATHSVLVSGHERPALLYDYYGFPASTYELQYPAPGHPQLALQVVEALQKAQIAATVDKTERGFDHGVFIPLKMLYPQADIPVVQVSLCPDTLSAEAHLRMGAALATLRHQHPGVLVVGSGQATHNLSAIFSAAGRRDDTDARSVAFSSWLTDTMTGAQLSGDERRRRLLHWDTEAPHARHSHPREEHLMPLHVVAGAALAAGWRRCDTVLDASALGGTMSLASYACYSN